MKCVHCGNRKFEERKTRVPSEVKGETVSLIVDAQVCTSCGEPVMDNEQANAFLRAASDVYRKEKGLLTSGQIRAYRQVLGMSQKAFAKYLNVGEASIKRWETFYVQEVGQDEHMRLKCDEAYAQQSALKLHWKAHPPDVYSGYRAFSWVLFQEALLYLLQVCCSPLFCNKALFYADFRHFQKTGQSITGARYIPLEYGPCPDQYQSLFQLLIDEGRVERGADHELVGCTPPNLDLFDDAERETLLEIANLARADGGRHLYDLSHKEAAYKETPFLQQISYEYSKSLQI